MLYKLSIIIIIKGSVNPEIVKNITSCNFLIIALMYIKVYISGMEWVRESVFDIKFS